jgi:AraC-like DNA-binding protein
LALYHWAKFRDHDELTSLIRGGDAEFIQRTSGAFKGDFTFLRLDNSTLQFGYNNLPYIGRGASRIDRAGFLMRPDVNGEWIWRGTPLHPHSIIFMARGAEFQDVVPGNSTWAFLSFERELMESAIGALTGAQISLPQHGCRLYLPVHGPFDDLQFALRTLLNAVHTDPALLQVDGARHGVEQTILQTLALALGSASRVRPQTYASNTRQGVMRLVEASLEARQGETVYLADLCAAGGVSERTLRTVFQETYGFSPVRYLKLRRLHQVRRALRRADSESNTVQAVAQSHGIWHLGRFAVEYRELFGESPRETLRTFRRGPSDEEVLFLPATPLPVSSDRPKLLHIRRSEVVTGGADSIDDSPVVSRIGLLPPGGRS